MPASPSPRLVFIVTTALTARFLMRGQLAYLASSGFEVHLVTAPGPDLDAVRDTDGVTCHEVEMAREIRPLSDLRSAWQVFRILRRLSPQIVSASTPKAGLIGMLVARVLRLPNRVYTVRGLRLETSTGFERLLLTLGERLASTCSHVVVAVSPSLRRAYVEGRYAPEVKTLVLGFGSSNGVDISRFRPEEPGDSAAALRASLGLEPSHRLLGFVGRLVADKGVGDLLRSFDALVCSRFPEARLLLVGGFESGDPVAVETRDRLLSHPKVIVREWVPDSSPWYRVMDLLVFPSLREGFPNAVLEAAACAVPAVAYAATGTVDAVADGETGLLVPRGDWRALGAAVCRYIADSELRQRHGLAARQRVLDRFSQETVWRRWRDFYRELTAVEPNGSKP